MSAIWGMIALEEKVLSEEKAKKMKDALQKYKLDTIEEYFCENVFVGCGVQYFTFESVYEKLPIVEGDIYFTADVMLDNREELLNDLGWMEGREKIPDGRIIFEIYKKYGNECLDKLLGSYSFVYYDKNENAVYMVSDATGTRSLYYRYTDGILEFSTSLDTLVLGEDKEFNERWLVDFLAMDNLAVMTEYEETMYKDIKKIEPARVLKFTEKGMEKTRYWNPCPKELKLKSDAEYKEKFIEVFRESVCCLLRSEKTAIMLSGGLDSSAVASFAALELKKQNKKLYSFTSVPEKDYVSDMSSYNVTDESEKVKKTAEFFGNLECSFIELSDTNAWKGHFKEMEGLEVPYKSAQNALWLERCGEEANRLGARIMLEGGYGNVTISYGSMLVFLNTLLSKGRIISYIKEDATFAKKYGWRKKQIIKRILKNIYKYYWGKGEVLEEKKEGKTYVKEEKLQKFQVRERLRRLEEELMSEKKEISTARRQMIGDLQFSQKGEVTTKHSLMSGTITRDPCMDKRVIEFCMSLPVEQFCHNGISRRLVREYLEGIVPDHIIKVEDYGYQSADMMKKVEKSWQSISDEMKTIYLRNKGNTIVDVETALEDIEELGRNLRQERYFDFIRLLYTSMVLEKMEK